MQNRRRASVRSRVFLVGVIAIVGAGLPALPAAADDVPAPPAPSAAARAMPTDSADVPTDQFIVKFKERAGIQSADRQSTFDQAASVAGVPVESVRTTASGEEVLKTDRKLGAEEAGELVTALAADPGVEYVEPDTIMRPFAAPPNDSYYDVQWPHRAIGVLEAWDISRGQGSVVAVVDTGIVAHSDLDANILPGYDMISDAADARDGNGRDPNPQDKGDASAAGQCGVGKPAETSSWHGTHVAGTIAAVAGNAKGVAGVAPKAKVVPVRALGVCGGYSSDIADAVIWAAGGAVAGVPANANPAKVINLSLGGRAACSTTYQKAIDAARGRGAAVVVASGNEGIDATQISPANCRGVIAVGASTQGEAKAYYSNFGSVIDISAPGGDMRNAPLEGVLSTSNNGLDSPTTEGYYLMQGTSMAAPHVAATAALMFANRPSITPDEVEERLKATAKPMYSCSSGCGAGLLDAAAVVLDVSLTDAPIIPATPRIGGDYQMVGSSLYVNMENWSPKFRVDLAYQWNRNGVAIPDATGLWYYLTVDDVGATITVTVTGTKANTPSVAVTSAPTLPIPLASLGGDYPSIKGQAYVGSTVTVDPGEWGPAPVDLTYQWSRSGTLIPNATKVSYTPVKADEGKVLTVAVTGTKPKYQTLVRTTEHIHVVVYPANKVVTPAPVVFNDGPYMAGDTYTVPAAAGVEYLLWTGGTVIPGSHVSRGSIKIWARAKPGFLILDGSTTEWATSFSTKGPDFTPPSKSPFKDVLTSQQFYKEMSWLADRKISTGWVEADKSVTYRPLTPINRDAMAAFLYRMAGSPEFTPPAKSPFKDVSSAQQFYKEMAWLAQTGISSGWTESDGSKTYRPMTPINRDAMAAFLYRLAGSPSYPFRESSPFQDVDTRQQFYYEMAWMYEQQISKGWLEANGSYTYRPFAPINRDAMAAFLYRMP
ncbi:S8 family serine peptidase [Paenarthrobacter sp. NPDC056912]|uniref:S8 family serine peptidase n=1 Tax=Paenarthrobacter sp. NPDC056912 TaxID=3345965 RepID=UPI0036710AC9